MTYMSPERIKGQRYCVMSDIWSVGITVVEMALGVYPYEISTANTETTERDGGAFWELLHHIVEKPAPSIPAEMFSPDLVDFCR